MLKAKNKIAILGALSFLFIVYAIFETFWIQTKTFDLTSQNIPSSFKGKKVVFATDIHCGSLFPIKRVDLIVKTINSLKPDLILLGGDYIQWNDSNIGDCLDGLKNLKAPMGVIGVLGNHDMRVDGYKGKAMEKYLEKIGINILNDQTKELSFKGQKIKIIGVEYFANSKTWTRLSPQATENNFEILICHNPDFVPEVKPENLDLILSGHTHGGQLSFFGLFAPIPHSKYGQSNYQGIKFYKTTPHIISNGIGTSYVPLRFFARPQIQIINL